MKKLWILVVVVAAVALFATCSLVKVSIDECISNFMSDVNSGNYSNLYTHLDSSSSKYDAAKKGTFWSSYFPSSDTYTLSSQSTVGNTVTATLTSNYLYTSANTIVFGMTKDSNGDYVISSISINPMWSTIFN
jgi:hypothetical protein